MKYIIEIEGEPFIRVSTLFREEGLYRAKGFKSLVFDQFGLDKLTPLDKALEEAYQKGYDTGSHESTTLEYQRGLDDAWETAKYLFSEMSNTEINLVFPQEWNNGGFKALMALDPKDAIDRIKAYEEQQKPDKIVAGDEVKDRTDDCGVVTWIYGNDAYVLWQDGSTSNYAADELIKTGRHFNFLASLLEAMKGEQRDCHTCKHKVASSIECVDCRGFGKWEPKEGED